VEVPREPRALHRLERFHHHRGISLTVARRQNHIAEIAVIPYTYAHTNIRDRIPGDLFNLEGDVLGKYVERYLEGRASNGAQSRLKRSTVLSQRILEPAGASKMISRNPV